MLVRKNHPLIKRRTLLRGGSVAVALPLLEAMRPTAVAQSASPTRLFAGWLPLGHDMKSWLPGAGFTASRIMQPLFDADLKDDLVVVSGLDNDPASPRPASHSRESASFLTCNAVRKDGPTANSTSMEQHYADLVGDETEFPSLQFGIDDGKRGTCGGKMPCVYTNHISWRGDTPLTRVTTAQQAFELLFDGSTEVVDDPVKQAEAEALRAERIARKKSLLDHVRQATVDLGQRLGQHDNVKLDEYLTSIRELETRLDKQTTTANNAACGGFELTGSDDQHPEHLKNFIDVIVMAFQCDKTRVLSFMTGVGGSNRNLGFLGIGNTHHGASHKERENYIKVSVWEYENLAYMLTKMKETPEGDSNLLHNSLVLWGSGMEDGGAHRTDNVPILLAGQAGGKLKTGRHVTANGEQLASLWIEMLQLLDVPINEFGNSTSSLGALS